MPKIHDLILDHFGTGKRELKAQSFNLSFRNSESGSDFERFDPLDETKHIDLLFGNSPI